MSHVAVESPNKPRPANRMVTDIADLIRRVEFNYDREGSGPGSRFEGTLREDVQAQVIVRYLLPYLQVWDRKRMPADPVVEEAIADLLFDREVLGHAGD